MSTHVASRIDDVASHSAPRGPSRLGWVAVVGGALVVGLLMALSLGEHGAGHAEHHGAPPLWWLGSLPFVALLGCIAVLPLLPATRHWWESNVNRLGVSLALAALTLVYYVAARGLGSVAPVLEHAIVAEYIPFIVLLFCLYVISGGITLTGDLAARPATNVTFLAVGALIASFIGTTGASMLLIRPLLQTNSQRKHVVHTVVFFIFLVSNVGGCLLPIGDPPLFLGYLFGVPFLWTMGLWGPWIVCCVLLLVVYYVWDTIAYKREAAADIARDETRQQPLRMRGVVNIALLGGIVACVALVDPARPLPFTDVHPFLFLRELLMLGLVALSLRATPTGVREQNNFNYVAILEVAALFIGIFIAMQVPIEYLNARGAELGIDEPWKFFWATGTLSSFLDNAPTYVVFFETAKTLPAGSDALLLGTGELINEGFLVAISLGAVFMGAMTYIGNGPNFMVKSIAEQSGVRMPSFFGFMVKYSVPVLVPVMLIVTVLFLLKSSPFG
ncbi:MAG: sodium:proton antiporter [Planctomycetes bacterium]|nr:sodium:proton antiporter [Planctomycetota bacterium]